MGVFTERVGAAGEYEEVEIPAMADTAGGPAGTVLRRRSPQPSRRAVLHVHSSSGSGVPEDLARWYTERAFHFYITGPPAPDGRRWRTRLRRRAALQDRFGRLDAACRYLRESDGIDSVVISAHSADALTVAQWCDARRDVEQAGAVILSSPVFGRKLRRGLRIGCPVLVLCPAADGTGQPGQAGGPKAPRRRRWRRAGGVPKALGPHVTWLWLPGGLDSPEQAGAADRRLLFDEMGRWLGAYMYGQVRDQLL